MNIKELYDLRGKAALITGGSQGIGRAIALALAEFGADIVINYRSGEEKAEQTKLDIEAIGAKCQTIKCDLSEENSSEIIYKYLEEINIHIDILILNASVQYRKSWDDVSLKEFDLQINTNLKASFCLIQKFYPKMQEKKWGRIITVGSVQQIRPHQQMIIYAASKTAQMSLVRSLAPQFGKFGVTINNIAPGAIETIRNEEALRDESYRKIVEEKIPAGYVGQPEDCVGMALLLCTDAGSYITGQNIYIDGGMGLNY